MKVFARKTNGNVIFYKDGYTDLRGHFEYITRIDVQSLGQFNKFAFLVVSDNLGKHTSPLNNPPTVHALLS